LHVRRGLEDGERQARLEDHFFDAQFLPVVIHLLRLRMQDGVIDKVLDAGLPGFVNDQFTDRHLVGAHIRTDMIHLVHALHGSMDRGCVAHVPDDDFLRAQRSHV
jgi:hypothetical protein